MSFSYLACFGKARRRFGTARFLETIGIRNDLEQTTTITPLASNPATYLAMRSRTVSGSLLSRQSSLFSVAEGEGGSDRSHSGKVSRWDRCRCQFANALPSLSLLLLQHCSSTYDRHCYSRWVNSSQLTIVGVGGLKQATILQCRFQILRQQHNSRTQTTSNSYPLIAMYCFASAR